jgi:hypothetical protein
MASHKKNVSSKFIELLLCESGNEVDEDSFIESESHSESEESDGCEVVLSIFRHAKSVIVTD